MMTVLCDTNIISELARPQPNHGVLIWAKQHTRIYLSAQADMLIAATVIIHDLSLVTRNIGDFDDCGLDLVNPFS